MSRENVVQFHDRDRSVKLRALALFLFIGLMWFDRRLSSLIITIIVAGLYGTAVGTSLIPEEGISWSGHFFGFLGGFVAARLRYRTAPKIYPGEHPLAVLNMPRMME